jgi:hypothetical protein
LRYDRIGRGFFVFSTGKAPDPPSTAADTLGAKPPAGSPRPGAVASSPATDNGQPQFKPSQLAMSWLNQNGILKFDTRPGEPQPAGWYRFVSAPGLKAMTITARGRVQVWVDGNAVPASVRKAPRPGDRSEQALTYKVQMAKPAVAPVTVALRIEQARGSYGGATLPEPILLDCGAGRMALGDWSKLDGLASYSGGVWYRKTVSLARKPGAGRVLLDLGSVAASAEVRVNGKPAGVKVAPPWTFDISKLVRSGDNRVEVLVYNTLANHYLNVPTNYRGAPTSGLMGPVTLSYD